MSKILSAIFLSLFILPVNILTFVAVFHSNDLAVSFILLFVSVFLFLYYLSMLDTLRRS